MSAVEYIITGAKKGKTSTFNADISIENQTVDDRLIESTLSEYSAHFSDIM